MPTIYLNFYGIGLRLESEDNRLVENIRRDFSFFLNSDSDVVIKIQGIAQRPDFKTIPYKIPFFRTRDALCYESNGVKFINYLGKALSIYNLKEESCRIICDDSNLLHEITYITILSRVGEKLDLKSIHRVHSLGFTYKDAGVVCMGSIFGGKTTLGLGLLNTPHVKLISDDISLINREHMLLSFPIRIGVKPGNEIGIPSRFCRQIKRKRFGGKVLIDIEYFCPKIVQDIVPLKFIFIVKKKNNLNTPKIKKAGLVLSIFSLFRDMALCRGVAQVKEYFIQKSVKDILSKIKILVSRIKTVIAILQNFKLYVLYLNRDLDKNVELILGFLEKKI